MQSSLLPDGTSHVATPCALTSCQEPQDPAKKEKKAKKQKERREEAAPITAPENPVLEPIPPPEGKKHSDAARKASKGNVEPIQQLAGA